MSKRKCTSAAKSPWHWRYALNVQEDRNGISRNQTTHHVYICIFHLSFEECVLYDICIYISLFMRMYIGLLFIFVHSQNLRFTPTGVPVLKGLKDKDCDQGSGEKWRRNERKKETKKMI